MVHQAWHLALRESCGMVALMKPSALIVAAMLLAAPAAAQTPAAAIKVIGQADATSSGQPVVAPTGPLRVTLSEVVIPAGGGLAAHKHPFPRYAYILSGRMLVTNLDTKASFEVKPGDLVLDPIDQWHETRVLGDEPVRLLTLDQTPPGAAATIRRDP